MKRNERNFPLPLEEGSMLFPDETVVCGGPAWELVHLKEPPYGHYLRLLADDDNRVVVVEMYLRDDSPSTNVRAHIAQYIEQNAKVDHGAPSSS